jgi:hypothetical protein
MHKMFESDQKYNKWLANNPRWRNAAQWARQSMIYDGYLKSDSPRGVWEVSDKGRKFLTGEID